MGSALVVTLIPSPLDWILLLALGVFTHAHAQQEPTSACPCFLSAQGRSCSIQPRPTRFG